MKTGTIYIDGYIGEGDIFSGSSFSLQRLNNELERVGEVDVLDVYINSGGGSVTVGWAIYDKLMSLPFTVNTIVNGMCGSISTIIFQAGAKGKRKMFRNSEFFVHNPYWQPMSPEPMEAKDLENLAEDLKKEQSRIENFYSKVTNKSIDDLKPILERQTTLTPSEAIEWGFVDEIVGEEVQAFTKYKLVAFLNTNNNKMNEEIKNELSGLKGFMSKIAKKLFKNGMITTDTGAMYFEGETVAVGSAVFADEEMITPLADGDYTWEGMKVVVVDGVVTELVDTMDANKLENALAEIEVLKAELASKNAEITAYNETLNETKKEFSALATKMKTFEAMVVTANQDSKGGQFQAGAKTEGEAPRTALEKLKAYQDSKK